MKLAMVFGLSIATASPLAAADLRDIELRRLFEPTPAELKAERQGRIFIYEGLRDRDVALAMQEGFERVEHMMFIRVQKTDDQGKVQKDPKTGQAQYYDDGC
jgi:hypothetical protein